MLRRSSSIVSYGTLVKPSLGVVDYWVSRCCNNRSCRIRCEPICCLIEDCSQISNATSFSKGIDKPLHMRIGLD